MQDCMICQESFEKEEMSSCGTTGHYICLKCLAWDLQNNGVHVITPAGDVKCRGQKCEKVLSPERFDVEHVIEITKAIEEHKKIIESNKMVVIKNPHYHHITNKILCRTCPGCLRVYEWESGCYRLRCSTCRINFCGLCQEVLDSGNHLEKCKFRPVVDDGAPYRDDKETKLAVNKHIASELTEYVNNKIILWKRKKIVETITPLLQEKISIVEEDRTVYTFYKFEEVQLL